MKKRLKKAHPETSFYHTIPVKKVKYSVSAMGRSQNIVWTDGSITITQFLPEQKEHTINLSQDDNKTLKQLIQTLDIAEIPNLTAPSQAFTYDGDAATSISFEKHQKTYQSPTFHQHNPPQELKALADKLWALAGY